MPFNRPALTELIDRAESTIEASLPGTNARLRRSNLNVLARVHSGAVHGLYGYQEFISRQFLPDSAEAEYLDRMASLWLDQPRKAAAHAIGSATMTGTSGVTIPAYTVLSRADGAEYTTDADATIVSGTATVAITAVVAGAVGNIDTGGSALTLVTPVLGVLSTSTVGILSAGSDTESDDSLRARISARMKEPPHGGSSGDYTTWALEVAGVTRAWVYPQELGAGTVTLRFVRDNDISLIPDSSEVAAVQTYIDALRPVTAQLTVAAPVSTPLAFTISVTPNTAAVKAAVTAELTDLLRRISVPQGASTDGTIYLDDLREAVKISNGLSHYTMTAPAADVTHTTGQIATMGTITWA
ncbi:MAG: baseplate J/gp47 family protein [Gallionella sp.]|jgi:uncharacterized phage protein gp47/JayE